MAKYSEKPLMAQIDQLNEWLESGRINRKQYDQLLEKIVGEDNKNLPPVRPAETGFRTSDKIGIIFLIIFSLGIYVFWPTELSEEEKQQAKQEAAERNKNGFHCLSAWDGSHSGVVSQLKSVLRDPSSYEHVETRVTPVKDGQHTLFMTYRAKNGFGGLNTSQVTATYSNANCNATLLSTR